MKQVIWVIVVLLVIWGVYALATGQGKPAGEDGEITNDNSSEMAEEYNAISLAEQTAGNEVMVSSYKLTAPGYIVVHAVTEEGNPGDIIGHSSLLSAGVGENVSIMLDSATEAGQQVIAMLHMDTDGNGEFDAVLDQPASMPANDSTMEIAMQIAVVVAAPVTE